jgi:hypothetical protein
MKQRMVHEPFGQKDMAHRRKRAVAMAVILVGLVVVFFVTTLVRLGGDVSLRGL